MTEKTRTRLKVAMGAVGALAVLLLHYKERDSYRCQVCFAGRDVFQWRLGLWPDPFMPLTPRWERIVGTRFLHDFLPVNHVHDWKFAQGSPYFFFGTTWGGCAIGGGRHGSELCQLYESSPEFRVFVEKKLRDGSLNRSNVVAVMSIQRTGEPSPLQKEADALLKAFFQSRPTPNHGLQ